MQRSSQLPGRARCSGTRLAACLLHFLVQPNPPHACSCPASFLCSNRQLPVFTAYIRWFRPKYVLMENVTVSAAVLLGLECSAAAPRRLVPAFILWLVPTILAGTLVWALASVKCRC